MKFDRKVQAGSFLKMINGQDMFVVTKYLTINDYQQSLSSTLTDSEELRIIFDGLNL